MTGGGSVYHCHPKLCISLNLCHPPFKIFIFYSGGFGLKPFIQSFTSCRAQSDVAWVFQFIDAIMLSGIDISNIN